MRLDTARRFALSLPEVTEEPHFDMSSFRVKGKIFCTVPPDGKRLHVSIDPDECRALIESEDPAYEQIVWGKKPKYDYIRVWLAHADRAEVSELLEAAWLRNAPTRVRQAYEASR
jgi:hypothetical protein